MHGAVMGGGLEFATTTHVRIAEPSTIYQLPEGPAIVDDTFAIAHGTPIDEDAYIFSVYDANQAFDSLPHRVTFFGHTHIPSLFVLQSEGIEVAAACDKLAFSVCGRTKMLTQRLAEYIESGAE